MLGSEWQVDSESLRLATNCLKLLAEYVEQLSDLEMEESLFMGKLER